MTAKPFLLMNVALVTFAATAYGDVIDVLGEQDFDDGHTLAAASEAINAGDGEVYPFDGTMFGHDALPGLLGSIEYTHVFDLPATLETTASLTIGLVDHDSFPGSPPLDTVDLFLDGVKQLDDAFLGISTPDSSVSVVTIPISVDLLLDGELTVRISTVIPGRSGNVGNSIFVDFSRVTALPEPATLLILSLGGSLLIRRRY